MGVPAPSPSSGEGICLSILMATGKKGSESFEELKSDMESIRELATCTICDQLLYEPWTLECGHTYCYSCLSSWFVANKRKKTCPDCRCAVKHMPAPAFLIKQMVEIFGSRPELLPLDESTEQHKNRQKEENDVVEADRTSPEGLFKGCFRGGSDVTLRYDEEDQVNRCTNCGHEYEGGHYCTSCGQDFEGDEEDILIEDFSDMSDGDSMLEYDLEIDADADNDAGEDDFDAEDYMNAYGQGGIQERYGFGAYDAYDGPLVGYRHTPLHPFLDIFEGQRQGEMLHQSEEESDPEPTESDQEFIDDEVPRVGFRRMRTHRRPSSTTSNELRVNQNTALENSSADDSDDSDDVRPMRVSRQRQQPRTVISSSPSVATGGEVSDYDTPNVNNTLGGIQGSGWSPLDNGTDNEDDDAETLMTSNQEEDSDSETETIGNVSSEGGTMDEHNQTTERELPPFVTRYNTSEYPPFQEDFFGYRETGFSNNRSGTNIRGVNEAAESVVDQEGDTEMSVYSAGSRNSSQSRQNSVEILGETTNLHEAESDSSEGSVRPAVRRRRAHHNQSASSQRSNYNPRIGRFAQHQSGRRDATASESPYFEGISANSGSGSRPWLGSQYRILSSRYGNDHPNLSIPERLGRAQRHFRPY